MVKVGKIAPSYFSNYSPEQKSMQTFRHPHTNNMVNKPRTKVSKGKKNRDQNYFTCTCLCLPRWSEIERTYTHNWSIISGLTTIFIKGHRVVDVTAMSVPKLCTKIKSAHLSVRVNVCAKFGEFTINVFLGFCFSKNGTVWLPKNIKPPSAITCIKGINKSEYEFT